MSNDVELISMSLGGEAASSTMDRAIEAAHSAGHLLLCAAGNEKKRRERVVQRGDDDDLPGDPRDVIAVTAMDEERHAGVLQRRFEYRPAGTGNGHHLEHRRQQYAEASGTSVACPFVTGVAALVWETRRKKVRPH